jgi:aquaporin Z
MKKYAMEAVGTGLFVFSILGIVASGSAFAPLAIGIALMMVIYIGAHVSGAHYNPAVTLALMLQKSISPIETARYITAQIIGALIAQWVATWIFSFDVNINLVAAPDMLAIFVAELIFTFALVTAVFQTAVSKAANGNSYFGLAIGAVVIVWATTVGNISGGFFNPAVLIWVGLFGQLSFSIIAVILLSQIIAAYLARLFYKLNSK